MRLSLGGEARPSRSRSQPKRGGSTRLRRRLRRSSGLASLGADHAGQRCGGNGGLGGRWGGVGRDRAGHGGWCARVGGDCSTPPAQVKKQQRFILFLFNVVGSCNRPTRSIDERYMVLLISVFIRALSGGDMSCASFFSEGQMLGATT